MVYFNMKTRKETNQMSRQMVERTYQKNASKKRIKDLEEEILLRNKIIDRFIADLPVDYIKHYNAIQASEHSNLKKSKDVG